jgi:hypothetical protein
MSTSGAGVREGQAVSRVNEGSLFPACPGSREETRRRRRRARAYGEIGWGRSGHRWRSDRCRPVRSDFGCTLSRPCEEGVFCISAGKAELDLVLTLDILTRARREAAAAERRRWCKPRLPARGIGRQGQFDPLSAVDGAKGAPSALTPWTRKPITGAHHNDDAGE